MIEPDDPLTSPASQQFLTQLGVLVVRWNDVERSLLQLLMLLAHDPGTAMILASDMNVSTLMQSVRTLATEYDVIEESILTKLASHDLFGHRVLPFEPCAPHVHHFVDYIDRLREYRNFYVHGIKSPAKGTTGFLAELLTARARLSRLERPISLDDLEHFIGKIGALEAYGQALSVTIAARLSHMRPEDGTLPTWPQKSLLPDKLEKRRRVLLNEAAQPQPWLPSPQNDSPF